jgi:hypothetical protein
MLTLLLEAVEKLTFIDYIGIILPVIGTAFGVIGLIFTVIKTRKEAGKYSYLKKRSYKRSILSILILFFIVCVPLQMIREQKKNKNISKDNKQMAKNIYIMNKKIANKTEQIFEMTEQNEAAITAMTEELKDKITGYNDQLIKGLFDIENMTEDAKQDVKNRINDSFKDIVNDIVKVGSQPTEKPKDLKKELEDIVIRLDEEEENRKINIMKYVKEKHAETQTAIKEYIATFNEKQEQMSNNLKELNRVNKEFFEGLLDPNDLLPKN